MTNNIVYIDEVGMGAITSCVMACAIVLPPNATPPTTNIKDSKQLTKKKREELYETLKTLPHAFGTASPKSIETLNIFHARFLAMRRALEKMKDYHITKVIVDGKFEIPGIDIPQEAIIKADEKIWEVGAASILAKVKRDRVMAGLAKVEKYSHYGWETNAGYYVKSHKYGIVRYGPTTLHRKNFMFFQYALSCRKEYEIFVEQGKSFEDYLEYENMLSKNAGKSHYKLWKEGLKNPDWK